ncbi:Heavy-metal resistance [Poseidonocella pacifica]|uniref:Heavy-metal resistance n=1 Tax=Poseidonocella pacifica TaxID=871651 RepID=A0A1I0Y4X7_9RHOB|nr:periplasmic heavy metal sensor [Poseidonocella pacifica]SFB08214.1 Heavy-metal resistance [Poseidonocella pacifica]
MTKDWTRKALLASVAINLLVLGLVLGMVWRFGGPERDDRRPPSVSGALYTRALAPEVRKDLHERMRARVGTGEDRFEGYAEMIEALRAEPFDPEAIRTLLTEQSLDAEARMAEGRQVLADYLATAPAEARTAFADRLEETLDRITKKKR